MKRLGRAPRLVFGIALAATAVLAVPLSASSAERQQVRYDILLSEIDFAPVVVHANGHVVRTEHHYLGLPNMLSGPPDLFGGEADADAIRTTNLDQMRGAVSGTWTIGGGSHIEIRWFGEFHGHVTPEGGSGAIKGFATSGHTLVGRWTWDRYTDPTVRNDFHMQFEAVISG